MPRGATLSSGSLQAGEWLPLATLLVLVTSFFPLLVAWKATHGMALRQAMAWSFVALCLACVSQWYGMVPAMTGRPTAGHWAYLSSLATLAALSSVLGARSPGGGAWAILMAMLVVVLLLPWLEGSGLSVGNGGMDRLRLDPTWAAFFAVVAAAGVTNYLPTRFGPAAALLGLGLGAEWAGLALPGLGPEAKAILWSIGPLLGGLAILVAWGISRRTTRAEGPSQQLWLWFRDRWGVVWALRVRERYNRAAASSGWPALRWDGFASDTLPPEADRTLRALLKRFADADRLDRAAGSGR